MHKKRKKKQVQLTEEGVARYKPPAAGQDDYFEYDRAGAGAAGELRWCQGLARAPPDRVTVTNR